MGPDDTLADRLRALWRRPAAPYVLAALVQLALAPWFIHDWDGFVFQRTVEDFLGGVTPYRTAQDAPSHIYHAMDWPAPNAWYAYPPLPLLLMTPALAVAQLLGIDADAGVRFALKLPLVAGNLLLAWSVGRTARALGAEPAQERRAVLLALFNPFLVFIGAVWGMFDAWMMALLLLSAVALHEGRATRAGLLFGGATLVKIFPLFVAPLFLVWALRRLPHARAAAKFVGASVATVAAVCLPFVLDAPRGFWHQIVGMHLQRPPQGLAAVRLPYVPAFTSRVFDVDLWPLPPGALAPTLSFALLVPGLLLLYAAFARRDRTLRGLLGATLGAFLFVLLVSKVVNEQYFVMAVAPLLALACAPGATAFERRSLHAWTWGGLAAGLLLGFHFLTFAPVPVALALYGMPAGEAVHALALTLQATLGLPIETYYALPDALSALAVLPAFLLALVHVAGRLREGAAAVLALPLPQPAPRAGAVAVLVLLLVAPAATMATTLGVADPVPVREMPPLDDTLAGVTYYLWWNNPSHDPARRDGNWGAASLTPADGYYTSRGQKIGADLATMRGVGFDFVAVSYHGYEHARYEVLSRAALDQGVYFAPLVELSELWGRADLVSVTAEPAPPTLRPTDDAFDAARTLVEQALKLGGSPAHLRIDGAPVVFLNDAHLVGPSWDDESRLALAKEVLRRHGGSFDNVSFAWGADVRSLDDIVARHPANATGFEGDGQVADDWRHALRQRQHALLDRVRTASGEGIHLVGTLPLDPARPDRVDPAPLLDGTFQYGLSPSYLRPPAGTDMAALLEAWEAHVEAAVEDGVGWATVHYALDDRAYRGPDAGRALRPDDPVAGGDLLGATWGVAARANASRILVASWNMHFDGTSIEPTVEHGEDALQRLAPLLQAHQRR